ncbi:hypothetical protein [Paracidovorax valerianellae]|uniref:hypothetical protein n=1 Tax=Paracidovorax valerianellae TaxID=187868 RepID=UPI0023044E7C|nr:hypothetical protein [Paracidovorax valerianellae]MDA8448057.1 hypothetical protein [Paracidovorax valerianellae]
MGAIKHLQAKPTNLTGGVSSLPANRSQAGREASATLVGHMRSSGQDTVNMNDLMKLARNEDGKTPTNVSDAASFMVSNPKLFSALESRDDAAGTRDGIASVDSFDRAANGAFDDMLNAQPSMSPLLAKLGHPTMPDHEVKDVLNTFRAGSPDKQLTAQNLYELSQSPAPDAPPALAQAAQRALKDPKLLQELGLNDGPGAPRKTPELSSAAFDISKAAANVATAA